MEESLDQREDRSMWTRTSPRKTQKRGRLPIVAEEEENQDVTDVPGPSTGTSLLRYRPRTKVAKTRAAELLAMAIKKYTGQERTVLDLTLELFQGLRAHLTEEE